MGGVKRTDDVARGRECYARHAWVEAYRCFEAADSKAPLLAPDLELYALSGMLTARDEQCLLLIERLYQLLVDNGDDTRAARYAFWLGLRLSAAREMGRAGGWFARAQRLTENRDCVEKGYLMVPVVHRSLAAGDFDAARTAAAEAAAIGDRFGDADLSAFARCLHGRVLLRQGQAERGLALLDEAMVAVMADQLTPLPTALVYCTAIAGCTQLFVMDRAREWTAALSAWCGSHPDLVPFSGTCMLHRAELLQLGGSWPEAIEEARRASERVASKAEWQTAADACYQQAEVHRLRGDFSAAERDYRSARERGREAQPGMALLRLAQGRPADAVAAIRGALSASQTSRDRMERARLLPAAVDIALAAGDVDDARGSCRELEHIAAEFGTDVLGAMAAHARGAVELAGGDAAAALGPLRHAFRVWHEAGAPYIAAKLRVLIARACRALGDRDTAKLELDLAREVFERLGAAPDLAAVAADDTRAATARSDGLSPRELEVLRLVATGKTNKDIARQLFLSDKTVDRHVSNIFGKIDVASRAAATAYAYQRGLV